MCRQKVLLRLLPLNKNKDDNINEILHVEKCRMIILYRSVVNTVE